MPDVDSTLRQITQWKHIITTDLMSAFYQIALARKAMKYCSIATPFRGVRVYARSAMGMPGSETALEELMCSVLGDLIHEGVVAKIADDLYCGADSPEELLQNWKWVALSASCSISLPRPDDQLWIITDGAVKTPAIRAPMYVTLNNKLQLAGFFSAKLRGRQVTWLPCEIEALSIAAAKHFSPYIIQSKTPACILTDSKPCVQSFEKLCCGEFSSSPRVATFLSTVSRYQASVRHVAGAAMLPSDFASRNAPKCDNPTCQVCSFIQRTEDSVVLRASVQSILSGTAKLPFTTRAAWLALQAECPDLQHTHAHLTQGHPLPRSWQTLKM